MKMFNYEWVAASEALPEKNGIYHVMLSRDGDQVLTRRVLRDKQWFGCREFCGEIVKYWWAE